MIPVRISETPFDPMVEYARFISAQSDAGAVASFTGQVRDTASDGTPVAALTLEGYRGLTFDSMQAQQQEALIRFTLSAAMIVHRIGRLRPGEPIVFVATAAAHRRAAFDAADWLMDQLKSRAILWKREERADGSTQWIEPTPADAAALNRWDTI